MALIVAFSVCLKFLNTLYLVVALRKKAVVLFQDNPLDLVDVLNESPTFHAKSIANNIHIALIDIATDTLIVALPIIILKQSMMYLARKLRRWFSASLERILDHGGEYLGNVSLIITAIIAIRNVFIARVAEGNGQVKDSIMRRFDRRLLSTLRLSASSKSSRRSPHRPSEDELGAGSRIPGIATMGMTRVTLSVVKKFIGGGNAGSRSEETLLESVDTAYMLESMDYYKI
ncbi:hypothetical protein GGR53DRAFT_461952 [Hypoxylon sp. FL1150]|nr:hypothetical protein GGR53DRAFT_461952 [Hypoxylon sp. FL1150]